MVRYKSIAAELSGAPIQGDPNLFTEISVYYPGNSYT